jgi:hypothetical protein
MSTLNTLRKHARVQEQHDRAFDVAFEAARILRRKREQEQLEKDAYSMGIRVVNQKHDLPF